MKTTLPALPPDAIEAVAVGIHLLLGFCGGLLAGLLLFLQALARRQIRLGILAWAVCLLFGTLFGTISTIAAGIVFWLKLRRPSRDLLLPPAQHPGAFFAFLQTTGILLLYFALQIVATSLASAPLHLSEPTFSETQTTEALLASGKMFLIVLNSQWLCLLLLLLLASHPNPFALAETLGLKAVSFKKILPDLLLGLGALLLLAFASHFVLDEKSREIFAWMLPAIQSPLVFVLTLVFLAPVFEELLFRGFLLPALIPRFGKAVALLLSSGIFAIIHVQYGWIGIGLVFCIGLVFGMVRLRTGSTIPSIALHSLNNLCSILYMSVAAT